MNLGRTHHPEQPDSPPRIVYESDDNLVVRQHDLESIRSDLKLGKWAIGVLAAFTASPKLGGPSAPEAIKSVAQVLQNIT